MTTKAKPKSRQETSLVTIPKEIERPKKEAAVLAVQVERLRVIGEDSLREAAGLIAQTGEVKNAMKRVLDPICEATHKAWKAATLLRSGFLAPVERVEGELKEKINAYLNEQQALREEAAEKNRLQQEEYQAKLERAKRPDRVVEPEPIFIPPTPKVSGIAQVEKWYWEISDMEKFLTTAPHAFKQPNDSAIREYVQERKGDAVIPGIRIWSEIKSQRS